MSRIFTITCCSLLLGTSCLMAQYDIPVSKNNTISTRSTKPVYKFELQPEHGPYLVVVRTFKGISENDPKARDLAERFAEHIRTRYRIPAYVYESSWAQRQEMLKEALALIEAKKKYYRSQGMEPTPEMLKVKTVRNLPDQYTVLVAPARGTLKDLEVASEFAAQVRKLTAPEEFSDRTLGNNEVVNPFTSAFPGPNPTIAKTTVVNQTIPKADDFLLSLNSEEKYSLLHKTSKPYTLYVKSYGGEGQVVQTGSTVSSESTGERLERAAVQANQLVTLLRANNIEAYVMHTRYNSSVFIGQFDSMEGPAIDAMIKKYGDMKLTDRNGEVLDKLSKKPMAMPIPRR